MRAKARGRSVLVAPPEVLASLTAPPDTLALPREYNAASHFIDRHLREGRGAKVALLDDAGETTYGRLAERVNRAGNVLRALGLDAEQRVLMCMLDTADFPAVFWGAIKIGAVAVPVNTLLSTADFAHMLRDSRARIVVVSAPLYPKLEPALKDLPFLRAVVVAGASASETAPGTLVLEELLAAASPELEAAPTTPDDVAFWLYSSGSTGAPKGAVHLHQDLVHTAVLYGERVLGIREDDVLFSAAKLFFAYGLGNAMTFPLQVGATAVLRAERPTPQAVMDTLRRHQPTIFFGVPTLFAAILADEASVRETGSRRLRICVSAGEALPREIGERWARRMAADILDGLGSTELLHIFLSNRPGDVRYGTTGTPVPGYELRLVDENGAPVHDGEVGELLVKGPTASPYYWNNRARSLATFQGPWTRTGDKYVRDAEGYYTYAGRSDDMI